MTRLLAALLILVPAFAWADDPPVTDRKDGRYEWQARHDPNGIGKFYMGREIAHVMGYSAASWLERPEREKEENPKKLLEGAGPQGRRRWSPTSGPAAGTTRSACAKLVGPKGKVLAVDIQQEMLDIIRDRAKKEKVTNVEPVQGDGDRPEAAGRRRWT